MNSDLLIPNNSTTKRGGIAKESLVAFVCLLFFIPQLVIALGLFQGTALDRFVLACRGGKLGVVQQSTPFSAKTGLSDPARIPALAPFLFLPIAINSCDKALLMSIRGIGPGLAGKILQKRAEIGNFSSPEDLLLVNGIGIARLRSIGPYLSFSSRNE